MKQTVFALGFFDGVHSGHRELLDSCKALAGELNAEPSVITFDTHPQTLVTGSAPDLINTPVDRLALLREQGIRSVQTLRFDRDTMHMSWQDFFRYLIGDLNAAGLVCGDDFRFGRGGEGTAQTLRTACQQAGIACRVVPEKAVDGIRVSSTHIRDLIRSGDMENAHRFLGHPHILSGQVVSGRKLGRTMGVPTANLLIPEGIVVPRFGVYACRVHVRDQVYLAVANVGTRPTVGGHQTTVEPWILDFDGDLYGKTITLEFHEFLRPEQKFPSLEILQGEIRKNAEQTRNYFQKR